MTFQVIYFVMDMVGTRRLELLTSTVSKLPTHVTY